MTQLTFDLSERTRIGDRKVICSVSGGKDSAAMSLYLTEKGIEHERVFMDTGWESPYLYDYLRGPLTDKIGPITEIRGEHDFLSLVRKKGLFPSRLMRFCTTELKVLPIKRYLAKYMDEHQCEVINTVGIRRAESNARSQMKEWEFDDGLDCEIWRPLVRWSKDDVVAIHVRHGLPLNPLYALGAGRVGCWPCIHSGKKEIALVAKIDPGRIDMIQSVEDELNEKGIARDNDLGREPVQRSMYSFHKGPRHIPITVREAVEWSRSKRGEWQLPNAGDGCMRYGLCESSSEEPEAVPAQLDGGSDDCAMEAV
jgi:3'-phosphoadenosine 5'-phosphosulfate sulfotransferase (PAPS reductase)/FAD synthetase